MCRRKLGGAGVVAALAVAAAVLVTTGCDGPVGSLPGVADPTVQAAVLTARYQSGDYPGTIDDTLADPQVLYHFTYVNGVTLWALTLLDEVQTTSLRRPQVAATLSHYVDRIKYRPDGGDEPIDYLGAQAHAALAYGQITGDERFRNVALTAAAYFLEDAARTPDDLIGYHSDPDRGRIWADALFMFAPLLAKAGVATGDQRYFDAAATQALGYADKLRNADTGLFHQGWNWHGPGPTPGHWGRANAWALVALTEILRVLPADHADRPALLTLYQDFAADIVVVQNARGLWHQLLDDPTTYEELSCSGMFTYALARGVTAGLLPADYAAAARRGHAGLSRLITLDGDLLNVCPGTGPQPSEDSYRNRGPRTNDSHGIGPAMLGVVGGLLLEQTP